MCIVREVDPIIKDRERRAVNLKSHIEHKSL